MYVIAYFDVAMFDITIVAGNDYETWKTNIVNGSKDI